ncbi:MAG: DNA repair protein RecN [Clostridia bacterium]|nr:DNA repair protein RecN [Clostridia bacterium]
MLTTLTIKNVALISDLTIDFNGGFSVLSGETGAGKSLIIDSISLLLGERADRSLISYGKDFAYVEAVFVTNSKLAKAALKEFDLDGEDQIIISRKITTDGKNQCRVNGQMFTLSMLKKISSVLIDLHGQFEHQSLLDNSNHIHIIDAYGEDEIAETLKEYSALYNEVKEIKKELANFTVDEKEREHLIDLYSFQADEINAANFSEEEINELKDKYVKFAHGEKIKNGLAQVTNLLSDGNISANELITKSVVTLNDIASYDERLAKLSERLGSAKIEVDDISETLKDILDSEEISEEEIQRVNSRLDLFSNFKKKYGQSVEEINVYYEDITKKLEKLTNCAEEVDKLTERLQKSEKELLVLAQELTKKRKNTAKIFENRVNNELNEVGLGGAAFEVGFNELNADNLNVFGQDEIEFMFSANVGQPLMPLAKVISGGEMSRFMLAVKSVTTQTQNIETMIFDEIDTGISGKMAQVIATKLKKLGVGHQVLCVSHMAQICAAGDDNYFILKETIDNKTQTSIKKLNSEEKVLEVARLISSSDSESAKVHAKELIENYHKN